MRNLFIVLTLILETANAGAQTLRLDFGTASSPVAAGFTRFSPASFSASRGYGWKSISGMQAVQRASAADPLQSDFHKTADGRFLATLTNGNYNVTVYLGDAESDLTKLYVAAEGKRVAGPLATTAAQRLIKTTFPVTVADGRLNLRLYTTQADGYIAVNGVEITPVASGGSIPLRGTVHTVAPGINIQNVINAAPAGDTIYFKAGTYTLSSALVLKSGHLYHGEPGAVLKGPKTLILVNETNSDNIAVDGLTFDAGRVEMVAASMAAGRADHITIANCIFRNQNLSDVDGALFVVMAKHMEVRNNRFENIRGDGSAIASWDMDNSSIHHNSFKNVHQGFSMTFELGAGRSGRNMVVSYNAGTGIERMAIEIQDLGPDSGQEQWSTQNLLVEGNWFDDWATTYLTNERFAYSIVVDNATGTVVRNNYASCGTGASVGPCDLSFELAGSGYQAYGNYVRGGFEWGPEVYEPGWSVINNNFVVTGGCTGNACVGLYSENGVNRNNTVISGNVSNPNQAIPPRPVP